MEDAERKIIRRKKGAYVEHVKVTDDFLVELRVKEILTPEQVEQIKAEKTNGQRVTKLLDIVLAASDPREVLNAILLKDYAWLSRDLETEVLAERGNLEIDEDIVRETGMLVHRKFGSSKRLCETDKREIQELMSLKLQIAKGEFQQELGRVKEEADHQTRINVTNDKKACKQRETIKTFLKDHEKELTTHAHGLLTTKEVLSLTRDELSRPSLDILEKYLTFTLKKFDSILSQRDMLLKEREKCLKILQKQTDGDLPLDEVVRRYRDSKEEAYNKVVSDANMVKRMRGRVADMEDILDEKENRIKELEEELKARADAKEVVAKQQAPAATPTPAINGAAEKEVSTKKKSSTTGKRPPVGKIKK